MNQLHFAIVDLPISLALLYLLEAKLQCIAAKLEP